MFRISTAGVLRLTPVKSVVSSETLNNRTGSMSSRHDPDSRAESGHVPADRMVILGSGGARIVVAKQLRASGGIWFSLSGTRFLVDPGPGSLVRMTGSRHRLDPTRLSGILLSHRHLDHSGDVNNMIEAMTMGGTEPRGALFAPPDALSGDDPVVLKYVRPFLQRIVTLEQGGEYVLGEVRFTCPVRHDHRGEVYGFRFRTGDISTDYADSVGRGQQAERTDEYLTAKTRQSGTDSKVEMKNDEGRSSVVGHRSSGLETAKDAKTAKVQDEAETLDPFLTISYVADTRYFAELAEHYRADVVIMNVVRPTPSQLDHLCAVDAEELVKAIRPKLAVLTHFGMKMLQARPWVIAREMSDRTGCRVVAASDGMLVDLEPLKATIPDSQLPITNAGAA